MKKTLTLAACLAALACVSARGFGQFDPPGWPQAPFPGARPAAGDPWNRPGLPGQNLAPPGRLGFQREEDKNRDLRTGLEALRHVPHVVPHVFPPEPEVRRLPVTEFKPPEFTRFKPPPVSEFAQVRSSWWKGGGLIGPVPRTSCCCAWCRAETAFRRRPARKEGAGRTRDSRGVSNSAWPSRPLSIF
jgi:hypothetical protein